MGILIRRRSLFWSIFPFILLLAAISAGMVFYSSFQSQKEFFIQKTKSDLEQRAKLFRHHVSGYLIGDDLIRDDLKKSCFSCIQLSAREMGSETTTRYTVILPDGKVVADSDKDSSQMENHLSRPEIAMAIQGTTGFSIRYSYTLKNNLMYVAIPVTGADGSVLAVIRTSSYKNEILNQINQQRNRSLFTLLMVLGVAGVLAWIWTRQVVGPIRDLENHLVNLTKGDLGAKFENDRDVPKELNSVINSLNRLAGEFDSSRTAVLEGQIQQGAILSNMDEGVIAIGSDKKVSHLNRSASKILGVPYLSNRKVSISELIRHPELLSFVDQSHKERKKGQIEITIDHGEPGQKIFIVRSSPIQGSDADFQGLILVLLDITELRRLESHRQEFVSNVSHELKTPLTSIKGFAETLQNPSVNSVEDLKKYAAIILKHADQLDTLIDDLLMLSKLENQNEVTELEAETVGIKSLINSAIEICSEKARSKRIAFSLLELPEIQLQVNSGLVTQALVNIIENAIKYSPEETEVKINVSSEKEMLLVEVADEGPGIKPESLPHVFERFYRVDKGRSRDMGGTGLGLSIVKHIMNAHGGEVSVSSEFGAGSRFFLKFPIQQTQI